MKRKSNKLNKNTNNRKIIGIIMLGVTILTFVIVSIRFSVIMVKGEISGEDLDENVAELYTSKSVVQAERGTIFDRNANPIALDASSYNITAILTDEWSNDDQPIHVTEPEKVAEVLSKHINVDYDETVEALQSDNSQVEFGDAGRNLSYDEASDLQAELNEQNLTGIDLQENQSRFYPNGTFASHIVGLAQPSESGKSEDLEGVMGLEKEFDEELTGENGARALQRDSEGYVLPSQQGYLEESVDGDDLYLTLDKRLQVHLENLMTNVEEDYSPKAMTATLLDANNGEIVASAQRPTFNATTKEGIDNTWQNLLVEYEFEPGSTMKVVTLAAAIEEGIFDPNETFMSGTKTTDYGTVSDVDKEGWGEITYLEGVGRSSNILFAELVEEMGFEKWKEYLDAFGFGQTTGIELPNETEGSNPYDSPLQRLNTGFGQGITATPVQMLQSFSAIANQGEMVQPRIVNNIADGETEEATSVDPIVKDSPISAETAQKTLEYLNKASVESEYGTSRFYDVEEVNVAAKTGTSQLVNPETGEYYTDPSNFNYSVVSMFPAEEPQYILYITVQQPDLTPEEPFGHNVVMEIYQPFMDRVMDYVDNNN